EGRTLLARQPAVGFLVADELFPGRVPLQLASQPQGEHAEVADRNGSMTDLGVADGSLPGAHTIKEVFHMIVADRQADFSVLSRLAQQFRRLCFDLAAGDEDLSLRAFEGDPMKGQFGADFRSDRAVETI